MCRIRWSCRLYPITAFVHHAWCCDIWIVTRDEIRVECETNNVKKKHRYADKSSSLGSLPLFDLLRTSNGASWNCLDEDYYFHNQWNSLFSVNLFFIALFLLWSHSVLKLFIFCVNNCLVNKLLSCSFVRHDV